MSSSLAGSDRGQDPAIRFTGVHKWYGTFHVLRNINLTVGSGERIVVCGPSGSGKSTTLAALVNLFNETRTDHVLTMEDPVEFVHPFKNCLVNQREVGTHTQSFARALRADRPGCYPLGR